MRGKYYRQLAATHPDCATLYHEKGARFGWGDGVNTVVEQFRKVIAADTGSDWNQLRNPVWTTPDNLRDPSVLKTDG